MSFISLMELIGTVAFAVSGALVAIEKKFDIYGVTFLAIINAVGGGIIRDVMINLPLPVALADPVFVVICIATAAVVICFYKWVKKVNSLVVIFDAVGLAAFAAIGAKAALSNDVYTPFVVITLAVLTGTGGGALRDVFAREIPFVLRKEVYATACIIGAIAFLMAYPYTGAEWAMYICFGVTLAIRLICVKFDWNLAKVNTEATSNNTLGEISDDQKGEKTE